MRIFSFHVVCFQFTIFFLMLVPFSVMYGEDDKINGYLTTSTTKENVEKVKDTVFTNRQITIRETAGSWYILHVMQNNFYQVLGMK